MISEMSIDFPDLSGCTMHPQFISETPVSIILWFYKASDNRTTITNIRVFLINARFGDAHIDFNIDNFPPLTSFTVDDLQDHKKLTVRLEGGGHLSFIYEKVFYFSSTHSVPPVGTIGKY